MGVFSSTMQLRGRPGLEYSDAGLGGTGEKEGDEDMQTTEDQEAQVAERDRVEESIRGWTKRKSSLGTQIAPEDFLNVAY